jgi:uncharacterized protein YprB with RNaseH-like and TPR domain
VFDKILVQECINDMKSFDLIIVFYGQGRGRMDIPALRTRALIWGLDFPEYNQMKVIDAYDLCKNKLRIHRYRLETIAEAFDIPAKQTPLSEKMWARAKVGDEEALSYVLQHNREDVKTLLDVWNKVKPFRGNTRTSI